MKVYKIKIEGVDGAVMNLRIGDIEEFEDDDVTREEIQEFLYLYCSRKVVVTEETQSFTINNPKLRNVMNTIRNIVE